MDSLTENYTERMVESFEEGNKSCGYVAKGFKKDANNILEMFHSMKTLKYEDFCEIWKKMHFDYIYCGRNRKSELKEFTEEVLHTTKEFVININNEFSKRVGALYLLYGLYFLQPVNTSCKIRMTLDNFPMYLNLIDQLRTCKQQDALYISCKLLVNRSFYFVVTPYNYGLHRAYRKYHDQSINILNVDTFSVAAQIDCVTVKNGLVEALNKLNEKYYQVKCALPGAIGGEPEESLRLVDPDIGSKLLANLEKLSTLTSEPSTSQLLNSDDDDDIIDEQEKKTNKRLLKQRAFEAKANKQEAQRSKKLSLKKRRNRKTMN